ncbi:MULTISPECIES: hypothetical protein [Paraburkholderia]|uniref:hypothetical protein n=1 Tax=Paraburkholderia TaxID=1822464 RepID=UPI00225ADEE5|nr:MULTISPECIES: hypothetical protein [Paraburkholderia]MCX4162519.1 hypothetical protein [Paraburkholderia megapolitana]MDN7158014.1 hypothetical protein [Paraburkholderia sp. CHISQ3]MDQ6495061.1 hypothetical protein [Paraburkholderia megapolitana]
MNHASTVSHVTTRAARVSAGSPDDAHLSAYNAAFSDLGLRFRWDRSTLDALNEFPSETARITAYIERFHAHLHKAYDADFLAQLILRKKTLYYCESASGF